MAGSSCTLLDLFARLPGPVGRYFARMIARIEPRCAAHDLAYLLRTGQVAADDEYAAGVALDGYPAAAAVMRVGLRCGGWFLYYDIDKIFKRGWRRLRAALLAGAILAPGVGPAPPATVDPDPCPPAMRAARSGVGVTQDIGETPAWVCPMPPAVEPGARDRASHTRI